MSEAQFKLDRTGFPLIWVDAINGYMHWLPVTKIQFEYFLCAVPDSQFDANWYEEVLKRNPRVTPKSISASNYWQAFITAVLPDEAKRFARWLGDGYSVPTLSEWYKAYQYLKGQSPVSIETVTGIEGIRERTRTLISRLDSAPGATMNKLGYERNRAYQMLMRQGVMEWVDCTGQRFEWGGLGESATKLGGGLFTPEQGQPSVPNKPNEVRLREYGLRLVWRDE